MANAKPSIVAKLFKGETIYQRIGVVDTWNWIVSCWENLKGDSGVKVDYVSNGEPKISLNLEAGENIKIEQGKDDESALRISTLSAGGEEVNIEAGYGTRVDKNGSTYIVSSTLDVPDSAGAYSSISFISNIEYDDETHQFKAIKTTVSAKILSDATTQEIIVFTATPHSAEHPEETE